MEEEIKKFWNFCGIHYINMFFISTKRYERNDIETKIDNDWILWLNEKYIEKGLDHKNLQEIRIKYDSDHRKHRYQLAKEPKNNAI